MTIEDTDQTQAVAVAADLARRAEAAQHAHVELPGGDRPGLYLGRLRADERLIVRTVETMLPGPTRPRGAATLTRASSFIEYVNRLSTDETTVWATESLSGAGSVTAVFNDHEDPSTAVGEADTAGWRDHTAELAPTLDRDWVAWVQASGQQIGQKQFAAFLLEHDINIVDPPPARLLPVVQQFQLTINAKFEQNVDLTSDTVQFTYTEETQAGRQRGRQVVEPPKEITLRLFVFDGDETPEEVKARLRWTAPRPTGGDDGKMTPLTLTYELIRPQEAKRRAWDRIVAEIDEGLDPRRPLLHGEPPKAVQPLALVPPRE